VLFHLFLFFFLRLMLILFFFFPYLFLLVWFLLSESGGNRGWSKTLESDCKLGIQDSQTVARISVWQDMMGC
jgi:hypothetical protein